jgi:broad specificity phosphatase PhoE
MSDRVIWIARHGNRLDFVDPNWFENADRPYDPPLSEDGAIQAQELGQRLKTERISHIFASPFLRTVQTANAVAEILDLPLKLEWGLCEWLNSDWMPSFPETQTIDAIAQQYPRIDRSYRSRVMPQYPENDGDCWRRTHNAVQQLVADFSGDLLMVGHGASVLGSAIGLVGGSPHIRTPLCCLVKIVRHESQWVLELNGDTSHLSGGENTVRWW